MNAAVWCHRCPRLGVTEARITEPISERIQRLARKVAVGPTLHRIALKGRQIVDRLVERDRQASCRAEIAGQGAGHRRATGLPWIPSLKDGRYVRDRPVHRERAAPGE